MMIRYKEQSIISGTGAAIWLKLTFGQQATIIRSSALPHVCTYLSARQPQPVVFCEGVQHRLLFCLEHLSSVNMVIFQFHLQLWKQRKVELVGE
jgi:hypothetical protein